LWVILIVDDMFFRTDSSGSDYTDSSGRRGGPGGGGLNSDIKSAKINCMYCIRHEQTTCRLNLTFIP
jgi:hypothetical protein